MSTQEITIENAKDVVKYISTTTKALLRDAAEKLTSEYTIIQDDATAFNLRINGENRPLIQVVALGKVPCLHIARASITIAGDAIENFASVVRNGRLKEMLDEAIQIMTGTK